LVATCIMGAWGGDAAGWRRKGLSPPLVVRIGFRNVRCLRFDDVPHLRKLTFGPSPSPQMSSLALSRSAV